MKNEQSAKNPKDFLLFIAGGFGVPFFNWAQQQLATMNSGVFSFMCMVITYCIISAMFRKLF